MRTHRLIFPLAILALIALVPLSGNAQEAKLKIRVTPKQAYVFVDGKAIGDGHRTVSLPAGAHEVGVYNYGYRPDVRSVTLTAGQTTTHEVSLQAAGGSVTGPWGRIQIEGGDRASPAPGAASRLKAATAPRSCSTARRRTTSSGTAMSSTTTSSGSRSSSSRPARTS